MLLPLLCVPRKRRRRQIFLFFQHTNPTSPPKKFKISFRHCGRKKGGDGGCSLSSKSVKPQPPLPLPLPPPKFMNPYPTPFLQQQREFWRRVENRVFAIRQTENECGCQEREGGKVKRSRIRICVSNRTAHTFHFGTPMRSFFCFKKTNVQFRLYYAGIFRTVPKIWKGISRGAAAIRKRLL